MSASLSGKRKKPTGGVYVYCRGCGRRGIANMALVGRARTVDECAECRPDRPRKDRPVRNG